MIDADTTVPTPAELLARARELAVGIAAGSAERDRERILPREPFDAIRRARIGALRVPVSEGGPGGSVMDVAELYLILGAADPNVAQALLAHTAIVDRLLVMATPAQRRRVVERVVGGEIIANATAEIGTATAKQIATRVGLEDGVLRVRGKKFYSTGSLLADIVFVSAVDDAGHPVYVVTDPAAPEMTMHDDWDGMGQRTTASGTTELDGVPARPEDVFEISRVRHHTGSLSQLIHSAIDAGIAAAARDDAVTWARTRSRPIPESGVSRAVDDPLVQQTIGAIATSVHAAEAVVRQAAVAVDRAATAYIDLAAGGAVSREAADALGVQAALEVAHAKIASNDAALGAGQQLFDIGGASATRRSVGHDRHWRNARTHTTHDPVGYRYVILGRYLLTDTPPPVTFAY